MTLSFDRFDETSVIIGKVISIYCCQDDFQSLSKHILCMLKGYYFSMERKGLPFVLG